ncbi:unnamed protein product [Clonostachys rosea]|uniref:Cytochrome P450 n=1 Tax=Bionectria ochroleuca TaxID=29856 RepID=A0ABY6U266_BIOOC|nr:unnamed protein product [Clonostachys rosea]
MASLAALLLSGPSVAVGIAALAAGLLYALYLSLLPKPLPGIPYNPEAARSLLGDLPALLRDENGPMDWILDQSRRHSGPICQVFLRPFSKPFVLISDYREAQDIMLRRKEWDRSDYTIEIFSGQAPGHHINQKTGPVWKAHRRLLQDLMLPGFLKDVAAPNIYASTLNLVRLWSNKERLARGRPFSAENDVFYAALDSVLEFSFGQAFPHRAVPPQLRQVETMTAYDVASTTASTTEQGVVEFVRGPLHETIQATLHASNTTGELMDSPCPRLHWWFKSKIPSEARHIRIRNTFLKEQVDMALERLNMQTNLHDERWVKSAVDLMMMRERISAQKEGREPVYWSQAIRDEIIGFVVAGHDTSSTTMLWGLKFLSDNQAAQDTLRAALHQAHGAAAAEGRIPTAHEITGTTIPYLNAVIEEILRLANTLPILDRQTNTDTTLFGHHIPKDTILLMLNRGPSFTEPGFQVDERLRSASCQTSKSPVGLRQWSPDDMDKFMPERWLRTESDGSLTFDSTSGPSLPFGLGTRGCFGRRLGYMELRIMVTLLVWEFKMGQCSSELSGYGAIEALTHKPKQCYVKLEKLDGPRS